MKVLLVTPPNREPLRSEAPAMMRDNTTMPPLGLLRLYASLRAAGHEARVLDLAATDGDDADALRAVDELGADVLGIGSTTAQIVDAWRLARATKAHRPAIVTILGGPHVRFFGDEAAAYEGVDVVMTGEADRSIVEVADTLAAGNDVHAVAGVVTANGGTLRKGPGSPVVDDLDALPEIDRSPLCAVAYRDPVMPGRLATTEMTRGCPYDCSFCSTPRGLVRSRSAENMTAEMARIARDREGDSVYFVDDTWNVNPKKSHAFCEEMVRTRVSIPWMARCRINTFKEDLAEAMSRAGCVRVQLGVEAGTDEGMETLRKRLDVDRVRKAFDTARRHNLATMGYFMIGIPSDRRVEDVRTTVDFARSLRPSYVLFNVFTPYPHTELYDDGVRRGIVDDAHWREFVRRPRADFAPAPWTEHLDAPTLYAEMARAYRRFYLRPTRVLSQLFKPSTWGRAAEAAWGMLRA